LPVFAYKGVTAAGKNTRGHLDAENARSARAKLRRDGIFVTEFAEQAAQASLAATATGRRFTLPSFQRISGLDLALLTRQAST
jgi:general secretion pathway protein F